MKLIESIKEDKWQNVKCDKKTCRAYTCSCYTCERKTCPVKSIHSECTILKIGSVITRRAVTNCDLQIDFIDYMTGRLKKEFKSQIKLDSITEGVKIKNFEEKWEELKSGIKRL